MIWKGRRAHSPLLHSKMGGEQIEPKIKLREHLFSSIHPSISLKTLKQMNLATFPFLPTHSETFWSTA
jgi:hypothetical protein